MKRWATFLITGLLVSVLAAEFAWYLGYEFEPENQSYPSLHARDIDPTWRRFSVLSYDLLPPVAQGDLPFMKESGFAFSKKGDFNGDGKRDEAIVGIYEDVNATRGRFLLILTQAPNKRWKKSFLEVVPGSASFSYLLGREDGIFWMDCYECGGGPELKWNGKEYVFVGEPT